MERITYNTAALTDLEAGALELVRQLRKSGYESFFVGGCVRDRLAGRIPKDIDIATNATPDDIVANFPDTLPVGAAFGVILVKHKGHSYEVATFREDKDYTDGRRPQSVRFCTAEEDALRRDFTINALFWDPIAGEIHDYCHGLDDLRSGTVRAIGNPDQRFCEDYLRMLRAVRFATRFNFSLDPVTSQAIKANATKIKAISAERIFTELNGILTGPMPARGLTMLRDLGLLNQVMPEVEAFVGVEQPKQYHPEGDVWVHTLLMLDHLAAPNSEVAWAVLLHDLGKPPTFELDANGVERFPCHANIGAEMAEELLGRLRCSKAFIHHVKTAVHYHMSWADLQNMRPSTLRRLMARESLATELELHRVDCMSSHRRTENYVFLLDKMAEFANEPVIPPPLVTGNHLIALGLQPGPSLGQCLQAIQELQLNGELTTEEDALAWVKTNWVTDNG